MLKQITLAAFALTAVSALAQDNMMSVDAKADKPYKLLQFVEKDAYKKTDSGSAYVISQFLEGLPGNYQTAVLRGLAMVAQDSMTMKDQNQTAANAMGPMGMGSMDMSMKGEGRRMTSRKLRSFEDISKDPMAFIDYDDAIAILQRTQDQTDQGLIQQLFEPIPFTRSFVMTVTNEQALDAICKYIQANAMATMPVRLKYTSLAPHTYVSPMMSR